VDAVTVAFGIRNVEDAEVACAEMRRVLVPAGRLAVLEFAVPETSGIRAAYLWYFNRILPWIGRLVSRHDAAYGYLPASVTAFASPATFARMLEKSGFTAVEVHPLTFGIESLFTARRGEDC
jgi:demethylmenaquinone methyltransferase/2-methoxy-6-polyprenyl-1,4-benzoquinol methylase